LLVLISVVVITTMREQKPVEAVAGDDTG
jgi:hypothetical protein